MTGSPEDLARLEPDCLASHLKEAGAVVLRGFNASVEEFEELTKEISPEFLVHHDLGRLFISADGTTQTVVPGTEPLLAHIERGYTAPIPGTIFFYCDRPAASDGETTLYDGFSMFNKLAPETKRFYLSRRLRFKLRISRELWERTLKTDDMAEALSIVDEQLNRVIDKARGEEVICRVNNEAIELDFLTPATRRSPRCDGEAFSNSALSFVRAQKVGEKGVLALASIDLLQEDNSEFPQTILDDTLAAASNVEIKLKWSHGDMAFVDNRTVLHGRAAFTDPERNIFVRIGMGTV
ncbi:MAG: TauD/TfdA family dioxygenase [Parvularculaceae bacterium]